MSRNTPSSSQPNSKPSQMRARITRELANLRLHAAIIEGNLEYAKSAIQKRANVNHVTEIMTSSTRPRDRLTPMLLALGMYNNESAAFTNEQKSVRSQIVKLLLDNGADPTMHEPGVLVCPLDYVAKFGNVDTLNLLMEKIDVPNLGQHGARALIFGGPNPDIVGALVNKGIDVNVMYDSEDAGPHRSCSALAMYATESNCLKSAEILLDAGAKVDVGMRMNPDTEVTPLMIAAQFRNADMCDLFLKRGADITNICYPGTDILYAGYDTPELLDVVLGHNKSREKNPEIAAKPMPQNDPSSQDNSEGITVHKTEASTNAYRSTNPNHKAPAANVPPPPPLALDSWKACFDAKSAAAKPMPQNGLSSQDNSEGITVDNTKVPTTSRPTNPNRKAPADNAPPPPPVPGTESWTKRFDAKSAANSRNSATEIYRR